MTDLNKLYDLTSPHMMASVRSTEERRRVELRQYLKRAVVYIMEMEQERADWPRLFAECNALTDLAEAGRIAGEIYKNHVLPQAQACAPPPRDRNREIERYEDRLDQEGYSC